MFKKLAILFKTKCPKCDSTNINIVKKGAFEQLGRMGFIIMFPILILFRPKKPLNVCRDCGFSWEDR